MQRTKLIILLPLVVFPLLSQPVAAFDVNPLIFKDLTKGGTYLKMGRSGSLKDEGIGKWPLYPLCQFGFRINSN